MIEQFDLAAEAPLGIGQRGIQCHERIVEAPQRVRVQSMLRNRDFG